MTSWPGRARLVPDPEPAGPALTPSRDAGMVTAEFAVALPALVVVVLAAVFAVAAVLAQVRCEDTAATAARMAARGDDPAQVRAVSLADAPSGAQLVLSTAADYVTATVTARVSPLGTLGLLPAVTVRAHVVAAREAVASGSR